LEIIVKTADEITTISFTALQSDISPENNNKLATSLVMLITKMQATSGTFQKSPNPYIKLVWKNQQLDDLEIEQTIQAIFSNIDIKESL
jgi:hypothetical protein